MRVLFILIILLIRSLRTESDPPMAMSALRLSEKITKFELSTLFDLIQINAVLSQSAQLSRRIYCRLV